MYTCTCGAVSGGEEEALRHLRICKKVDASSLYNGYRIGRIGDNYFANKGACFISPSKDPEAIKRAIDLKIAEERHELVEWINSAPTAEARAARKATAYAKLNGSTNSEVSVKSALSGLIMRQKKGYSNAE